MASEPFTYEQYLDLIADPSGIKIRQDPNLVIERFSASQNISARFAPVTFLLDFATRKYIHVQESCFNLFGYSKNWFMESGLTEFLKTWHPADFEIINEKIFSDNMEFLKTIPPERFADYIFSYNYRVLNPNGEFVNTLQRFSYIPNNSSRLPAGMVGVAFDITHFKNDTTIVHTIEESKWHNNQLVNKLVFKKIHAVNEVPLITNREKEILMYLATGLSSKQIADKLKISINTISNHRKNMLSKTNCKSSAELINYAAKHGLM